MDRIAVDADLRGRGVGGLPIEEVAAVAAELGCRQIRLDVVDNILGCRAVVRERQSAH
ncbi:hypothetical protein SALBM135S_09584 [Streptomyces alboniger]